MKWLDSVIDDERRALEKARQRFVRKPTEKHLHDVRIAGRRFRSLLEDVADLEPRPRLLRRVKRAAEATDVARDATIVRELLERTTVAGEEGLARPVIETLCARERDATRRARRRLRAARFRS